ncbi:MAG: hypothetical protein CL526_03620 [Aequorivita sp.]|nr:hypothetical protein [Aequorivita sp.]|tara:strand:- start:746 stop:1225 length:480 start_codon:yes stop_codon:yes gene_type:complete
MLQRLLFIFLLLLATSCQYFETEKVNSEKIYNEEIKAIDWKDVDRYPSFAECENTLEKLEQKQCFINTISTHLLQSISDKNLVTVQEISDTIKVNFEINSQGDLRILEIKIDSLFQREFPELESWIVQSIDSLKPVAPAYKRSIPVKTRFTLPVVIQTN